MVRRIYGDAFEEGQSYDVSTTHLAGLGTGRESGGNSRRPRPSRTSWSRTILCVSASPSARAIMRPRF
jgi:hypothetical protein